MAGEVAQTGPAHDIPRRSRNRKRDEARTAAYEQSGPEQLALQNPKAQPQPAPDREWLALKQHLESRLIMLRAWRMSWIQHWSLLESYILPRRGIFINAASPTPNTMIRGLPINQTIIDPTGTQAMRRCAAGMMSGLMSPSRPWFKLKPQHQAREEADEEVQVWFEEVEDRMYDILGRSNFYDSGAQMFEDLVTFGTSPMILYEDEMEVIRAYVPCPGEYFLASSNANRVESLFRQFVMTTAQIVEMFGLEQCPAEIQSAWQQKGNALEVERLIGHAIEPNFPIDSPGMGEVGRVEGDFTWRECYWVWGASSHQALSIRGFNDQPHIVPRWSTTSNDPYGRSVAMDVLPDIMQLQQETLRKAEALEKQVRPPMLASAELKNEPSSILPGKVTYVAGLGADKGMRPIYTVNPNIKDLSEDLMQLQKRIQIGFFNDLFMMLETASNKNMTAYEVAQRQQEKLQVLGPVIEKLQNECLAPAIKRVFRIMERKGMLPPIPEQLQNAKLGIEYIGMLALAQKASSTAALERFAATMGNMQAADPNAGDMWDRDEWTREYAENLFISKKILNSPEQVAKLRMAKQKQMQAMQQMQTAQVAAQGAETLSNVDVGGGQNAIQAMLGTAPSPEGGGM